MTDTKRKADSVSFEIPSDDSEGEAKRFTLRLTPSAWIELEDAGLGDIQEIADKLQEKPSFKTFLKVFAAALRGGMKDRELTDETALEIADELGSEDVMAKITQVIEASFPAASEDAKGEAGKKPARPKR